MQEKCDKKSSYCLLQSEHERTENDNPGANLVTCHTMFLKIIDTIKLLLLFFCLALTGTKCVLTASMQKVHNHVRTVYS